MSVYVTVKFTGINVELKEEFEVDNCLEETIQDFIDSFNEEHEEGNEEGNEQAEITDFELLGVDDDDYKSPEGFDTLKEFIEYVDNCEKHGEAYRLRYDDVGDNNFDNEYMGCWPSEEEYVQTSEAGLYEIPDNLWPYIDWEKLTRDVMRDYSSYEGDDGVHIFRN